MLARRVGRAFAALLVTAGLLLGALLIAPSLLGWERYVLVSGSMTGTYDRGSLVFDEIVPTKSLKVGDVITYKPPRGLRAPRHRHPPDRQDQHGPEVRASAIYRTKGDANKVVDPWTFMLQDDQQARVKLGVPYVGYALAALADRTIRMLIIGIPAGLIALFVMAGLWRDAGREAEALEASASVSA